MTPANQRKHVALPEMGQCIPRPQSRCWHYSSTRVLAQIVPQMLQPYGASRKEVSTFSALLSIVSFSSLFLSSFNFSYSVAIATCYNPHYESCTLHFPCGIVRPHHHNGTIYLPDRRHSHLFGSGAMCHERRLLRRQLPHQLQMS